MQLAVIMSRMPPDTGKIEEVRRFSTCVIGAPVMLKVVPLKVMLPPDPPEKSIPGVMDVAFALTSNKTSKHRVPSALRYKLLRIASLLGFLRQGYSEPILT